MICDPINLLEKVHEIYQNKSQKIDQQADYMKLCQIISNFLINAENHSDNIQPKDFSSSELKSTYLTEKETWSYLLNIYQSSFEFKAFFESKKPEKFSFFKLFNPNISQIFLQKDLQALDSLRFDSSYLNISYITDLSLINDIMNYDEILWTLHSLVPCFAENTNILQKKEKEEFGQVDDFKEVARLAEWDFMGSNDSKSIEEMSKFDNKLLEEVYKMLRNGRVIEAQDWLLAKNRYVFSANLNSGLAYHDFARFDREILQEERRGEIMEERLNEEFNEFDWKKKGLLVEKINHIKTLDFMFCKDFQVISEERRQFYLEKEISGFQDEIYYQGACGNRNWLFSLSNFFILSKEASNKYEKAIYGYMSSNPLTLRPLAIDFRGVLWVYLRCFLNQEVIKRFIVLIYLFKENLLSFCMFDENFLDFEKKDPFQIYEQIIQNSEEVRSMFGNLNNVLKEISQEEEINKYYNKVQFLLIKCRLLNNFHGSQEHWEELYDHLCEIANININELQNLEFCAYFSLILRALGFYDSASLEKIDQIIMKFAKFNRKQAFSPQEHLKIFNFLNNEELKISSISQYLLTLDPKKADFPEIKRNLMELMPKLAPFILERLFLNSHGDIVLFEEGDMTPETKRIQALNWLFADKLHIEKALSLSLKLLRNFIIEGKRNFAKMVFRDYIQTFLNKDQRKHEDLLRNEGFILEIQAYELYFIAEEAFNDYFEEKKDFLWQTTIEIIRNLLMRNSIENERFTIIDLKNPNFKRILEKDPERKDEVFAMKSVILSEGLEFLLRLYENQEPSYEIQEILDILTDEKTQCELFLNPEQFRVFLSRFTNLLLKSRDFMGNWLERTKVEDFDNRYFS